MNNIYRFSILLLLTLIIFSCEDNLEIDPEQSIDGSQALSSEQNLDALLLGIYQESGQGVSFGGDIQIMADLLGASDQISWFGTFVAPRQLIQKSLLVDNTFVRDTWFNNYESINQTNLIIDNLDIITSSDDKKLETEELVWDEKQNKIYTDKKVKNLFKIKKNIRLFYKYRFFIYYIICI